MTQLIESDVQPADLLGERIPARSGRKRVLLQQAAEPKPFWATLNPVPAALEQVGEPEIEDLQSQKIIDWVAHVRNLLRPAQDLVICGSSSFSVVRPIVDRAKAVFGDVASDPACLPELLYTCLLPCDIDDFNGSASRRVLSIA